jgi:hypothetical protein
MRGPWQLNGQVVRQGEAVPPGGRLLLKPGASSSPAEPYAIDVVLLNNAGLSLRCPTAARCQQGLTLPASLSTEASVVTRLAEVFRVIFEKPERFVGLMSRDASPGAGASFTDGVARLDQGRARLEPFLQDLPAGDYRLMFVRLSASADPSAQPSLVDLLWDRSPESATPNETFVPGLYRITLTRPRDTTFASREAWMLLAPEPQFSASARAFGGAIDATRSWDRDVPARDLVIFRRAYLSRLAVQAP